MTTNSKEALMAGLIGAPPLTHQEAVTKGKKEMPPLPMGED